MTPLRIREGLQEGRSYEDEARVYSTKALMFTSFAVSGAATAGAMYSFSLFREATSASAVHYPEVINTPQPTVSGLLERGYTTLDIEASVPTPKKKDWRTLLDPNEDIWGMSEWSWKKGRIQIHAGDPSLPIRTSNPWAGRPTPRSPVMGLLEGTTQDTVVSPTTTSSLPQPPSATIPPPPPRPPSPVTGPPSPSGSGPLKSSYSLGRKAVSAAVFYGAPLLLASLGSIGNDLLTPTPERKRYSDGNYGGFEVAPYTKVSKSVGVARVFKEEGLAQGKSNFGRSNFGDFESYIQSLQKGTIRATQFVLEARPFNSYTWEAGSPLNPIATKLFKSEASVLNAQGAEVVLDTLNIFDLKREGPNTDKTDAFKFLQEHYRDLRLINYNAREKGASQQRLFHSKIYLGKDRETGEEVARLDTSPGSSMGVKVTALLGTGIGGASGFALGASKKIGFLGAVVGAAVGSLLGSVLPSPEIRMGGMASFRDVFYETSNPEIVKALNHYYEDVKARKVVSQKYNNIVIAGNEITASLTEDVRKAQGQVIVYSATIGRTEFTSINKGRQSLEDLDQTAKLESLLNSLKERGVNKRPTIVYSEDKKFESIREELKAKGVLVPDKKSHKKLHYNISYLEDVDASGTDVVYISTRRLSEASHEEIALRLTTNIDAEAISYFKSVLESDLPIEEVVEDFKIREQLKEHGIVNSQFAPLLKSSEDLMIPARMGASYFYSRALYNVQMKQGGHYDRVINNEDVGLAASMYRMGHLAHYGAVPKGVPYWIAKYDRELGTGGLGASLNEWSIGMGWGRLYKDEVGFFPSIAGAIGKVLDQTWLFFDPDKRRVGVDTLGKDVGNEGIERGERAGFLEGFFSHGTNVALSSAAAIGLYLTVGEPVQLLMGELFKDQIETSIKASLNKKGTFASLTRLAALGSIQTDPFLFNAEILLQTRAPAKGLSKELDSLTVRLEDAINRNAPGEAKRLAGLIEDIEGAERLKRMPFFKQNKMSAYGIASTFLRERAESVFNDILRPFFLDVLNPFSVDTQEYQNYRSIVDDFAEEIGKAVDIKAFYGNRDLVDKFLHMAASIEEGSYFKNMNPVLRSRMDKEISTILTTTDDALRRGRALTMAKDLAPTVFSQDEFKAIQESIQGISIEVLNVATDRSSRISYAMQELLNVVPLNPFHWGKAPANYMAVGDVFSFHGATQEVQRVLFGKGGLDELLMKYQVVHSADWREGKIKDDLLAKIEHSPIVERIRSFTSLLSDVPRFINHLRDRRGLLLSLTEQTEAFAAMERRLFEDKMITLPFSEEWDRAMRPKVMEELEGRPKYQAASPIEQERMIRREMKKRFDPNVRSIHSDSLTDEMWDALKTLDVTKTKRKIGDALTLQEIAANTYQRRSNSLGLPVLSDTKNLQRRLDKTIRGAGGDATQAITREKFTSFLPILLGASALLNHLFTGTSGTSLITALLAAPSFKGVSPEFVGGKLLPDIEVGGLTVSSDVLAHGASWGLGYILAEANLGVRYVPYTMSYEAISKAMGRDIGFGLRDGLESLGNNRYLLDLKGIRIPGELTQGGVKFLVSSIDRTSFHRNAAIYGLIGYGGLKVASYAGAALLNASRRATSIGKGEGTIDPLLGGIVGATLGYAMFKKRGVGLLGTLGGLATGAATGWLANVVTGFSLYRVGKEGPMVDPEGGTLVSNLMTLSSLLRERKELSRLELMGAFYIQDMAKVFSVIEERSQPKTAQVVARQATIPFIHFYLAQTEKSGRTTFTFGIQGPAITGISVGMALPFSFAKVDGKFKLAANEDNDLFDVLSSTTATLGLGYGALSLLEGMERGVYYASTPVRRRVGLNLGDTGYLKDIRGGLDWMTQKVSLAPRLATDIVKGMAVADINSSVSFMSGTNIKGLGKLTAYGLLGYTAGSFASLLSEQDSPFLPLLGAGIGVGAGAALSYMATHDVVPSIERAKDVFRKTPLYAPAQAMKKGAKMMGRLGKILLGNPFAAVMSAAYFSIISDNDYGLMEGMSDRAASIAVSSLLIGYGAQQARIGMQAGDVLNKYLQGSKHTFLPAPLGRWMRAQELKGLGSEMDIILKTVSDMNAQLGRGHVFRGNMKHLAQVGETLNRTRLLNSDEFRRAYLDSGHEFFREAQDIAEGIGKYGRGLRPSFAFASKLGSIRLTKFLVGFSAATTGITSLAFSDERRVNAMFDFMDNSTGVGGAVLRPLANAMRLIFRIDRSFDDTLDPKSIYQKYSPGMKRNRILTDSRRNILGDADKLMESISQLAILNPPNPFISIGPGGFAIRGGDKGLRFTPYVQFQGAGADVSTAMYSMSSVFLFREVQGSVMMHTVVNAMREINETLMNGGEVKQSQLRRAAHSILQMTANTQHLSKARKVSSFPSYSEAEKDPLVALVLEHRRRTTRNFVNQPALSLASQMLHAAMTTAHRGLDTLLLRSLFSNDGEARKALYGDPFKNLSKDLNIVSALFFSRGQMTGKKKPEQSEWSEEMLKGHDGKEMNQAQKLWEGFKPLISSPFSTIGVIGAGLGVAAWTTTAIATMRYRSEIGALESVLEQYWTKEFWVNSHPWKFSEDGLQGAEWVLHEGGRKFKTFDTSPLWSSKVEQIQSQIANLFSKGEGAGGVGIHNRLIGEEMSKKLLSEMRGKGWSTFINDLTETYTKAISPYIDKYYSLILDDVTDIGGELRTFGDLLMGDEDLASRLNTQGNIKEAQLKRLKTEIKEVLAKEVYRLDNGLPRLKGIRGGEQVYEILSTKVLGRLTARDGLFHDLRHNWGGLADPLPLDRVDNTERALEKLMNDDPDVARPKRVDAGDSLQRMRVRGVTADWKSSLLKGGKGFAKVAFFAFDVVDALDVYGNASRLANLYDKDAPNGYRYIAAMDVGATTVNSLGLAGAVAGVSKLGGMGMAALAAKGLGMAALFKIGAIGLLAFGAFYGLSRLNEHTANAVDNFLAWSWGGVKKAGSWLAKTVTPIYEGIQEGVGKLIYNFGEGLAKIHPKAASVGVGMLGSLFTGAVLGLGLLGAGISLGAAAGVGVGLTALGTVASAFFPSQTDNFMSQIRGGLTSFLKQFGLDGFIQNPGDWMKSKEEFKIGGPFRVQTVDEALAEDRANQMAARRDYTGATTASSYTSGMMSNPYRGRWSGSFSPSSMSDPLIAQELRIRGQYTNKDLIGGSLWRQLVKEASNYNDIKAYEELLSETTAAIRLARAERHAALVKKGAAPNISITKELVEQRNALLKRIQQKKGHVVVKGQLDSIPLSPQREGLNNQARLLGRSTGHTINDMSKEEGKVIAKKVDGGLPIDYAV